MSDQQHAGYQEPAVDATLTAYFAQREAARTKRVSDFLDNLTPRERALVQDIAVMGYVQGSMHPKGERIPKSRQLLTTVVDACFAFPDQYPVVATLERCPGFPERCPNLRAVPPKAPEGKAGVRCGCDDEEKDG